MPSIMDQNRNLSPEEMQQLGLYLTPDKAQGPMPLPDVPRATVASHQVQTPVQPVPTSTGAPDENNGVSDNDSRIEDSHPGHTPDDMAGYVQGQEAQIDKYGPEQEQQVLDSIMKERGSLGNRIGNGLSGFADAVIQAGGGSSDFARQRQERQNRGEEMQLNAPVVQQEMNAKNMAAKQGLEGLSNTTALGKSQAAGPAGLLAAMGVPKDQIAEIVKNPAAARSIVEPWTQMMGNKEKAQVEMLIKQLDLGQQKAGLEANMANQQAQRENDREKLVEDREKLQIEHPIMNMFGAIPDIPGGESSSFDHTSIPAGTRYTAPDGTTRIKR